MIDPLGNEWDYTYDDNGNRITAKNPRLKTTHFAYNDANELTTETFPDSSTINSTYTSRGELASLTDQLGNKTTFSYDAAGRLHTKVTPRATSRAERLRTTPGRMTTTSTTT